MKPSQILRKAARSCERDSLHLGCVEIENITCCDRDTDDAMAWFELVRPDKANPENPWWGTWANCDKPEHQNARVIGLCLAAAIAESEGQ